MEIIINSSVYCEIEHLFNNYLKMLHLYPNALSDFVEKLVTDHRLPIRTAASILHILFVRKMKSTHFRVSSLAPTLWNRYKASVQQGHPLGIILQLARQNDSSPALLAKLCMDQCHFEKRIENVPNAVTNNQESNCKATDDHQGSQAKDVKVNVPGQGKNTVSKQIRDTSLIEDGRLAKEVLLANYLDDQYGPISEMFNRAIGEEYEQLLYKLAHEASLSFLTEKDLRTKGYDKTPDLKLNVPIAVDGFVVNWIESKGLFGDQAGHRSYISKQYSSYWNRFGPGLVIYWLGYEDSIAVTEEKRFIVRGCFPSNILHMKPLG